MKRILFICPAMFVTLLLIFACTEKQKETNAKTQSESTQTAVAANAVDELLIQFAAEKMIGDMSASLKASLREAIRDGNFDFAIDVCSHLAPEIAAAHSKEGWTIKRVSDKNRDPGNAADSTELGIMAAFAAASAPDSIGSWNSTDAGLTYTYYKPIKTEPLCLNCHGPKNNLASGVSERLRELYPRDRAVDYNAGDLRGMFVVEVNWPEGKSYAQKLVEAPEYKADSL